MKDAVLAHLKSGPEPFNRSEYGITLRVFNARTERPVTLADRGQIRAALKALIDEGKVVQIGRTKRKFYTTQEVLEWKAAFAARIAEPTNS